MYLPRQLYEILPYLYGGGGLVLCVTSYAGRGAPWSDGMLVLGAVAVLVGLVLVLRRRSYRVDASRYDSHSLDH